MRLLHLCVYVVAAALASQALQTKTKDPKTWALLIAGSSSWSFYGDQSGICATYQVLHRHGIPDENIVVMIYDDVAHDPQNPTPGVLINWLYGENVYAGVPIDYKGEDITPANFLKVLSGDKQGVQGIGTGRVIASGPEDHVFVFFEDHGSPGSLVFPSDELTVKDLTSTLLKMHHDKTYGKLVFFVDACFAGSMFAETLPSHINIYASTSANPDQEAFYCQYDQALQTYISGDFDYNFRQSVNEVRHDKFTMTQEYNVLVAETTTSNPQRYGDLSFGKAKLSEFFGRKAEPFYMYPPRQNCSAGHEMLTSGKPSKNNNVLQILEMRELYANDVSEKDEIVNEREIVKSRRLFVDAVVKGVVAKVTSSKTEATEVLTKTHKRPIPVDCHHDMVKAFSQNCFNLGKNPYALKYVGALINLCNLYGPANYADAVQRLEAACKKLTAGGIL